MREGTLNHYHHFYVMAVRSSSDGWIKWYNGEASTDKHLRSRVARRLNKWGVQRGEPNLFIYTTMLEVPKDATHLSIEQGVMDTVKKLTTSLGASSRISCDNKQRCSIDKKGNPNPSFLISLSEIVDGNVRLEEFFTNNSPSTLSPPSLQVWKFAPAQIAPSFSLNLSNEHK